MATCSDLRIKKLIKWLDILIAESELPLSSGPHVWPRCWKCGQEKIFDDFKGEYCPRCNDWN